MRPEEFLSLKMRPVSVDNLQDIATAVSCFVPVPCGVVFLEKDHCPVSFVLCVTEI